MSQGKTINRKEALKLISTILKKFPDCRIEVAGSYRRMKTELSDLDIVTTALPYRILEFLRDKYNGVIPRVGTSLGSVILESGIQIDVLNTTNQSWGAAMLHATGSGEYNRGLRSFAKGKGFKLNQTGLYLRENPMGPVCDCDFEESIYLHLGLKFDCPWNRDRFVGPNGELYDDSKGRK